MSKHEVIIGWSKDADAFIAEAPELPGCAADGSTRAVGEAWRDNENRVQFLQHFAIP